MQFISNIVYKRLLRSIQVSSNRWCVSGPDSKHFRCIISLSSSPLRQVLLFPSETGLARNTLFKVTWVEAVGWDSNSGPHHGVLSPHSDFSALGAFLFLVTEVSTCCVGITWIWSENAGSWYTFWLSHRIAALTSRTLCCWPNHRFTRAERWWSSLQM